MIRNRKLNRLKDYDYAKGGFYFVTVCTQGRKEWLGEMKDGAVVLNEYGAVVNQQWAWLREQYPYVELDEFIVMPNHFHGILSIVGNGRDRSLRQKVKSLSELVGAFKTTSSKLIRRAGLSEFQWQKSFYDHIIRNDADLARVREYIHNNPLKWEEDEENVKNRLDKAGSV